MKEIVPSTTRIAVSS